MGIAVKAKNMSVCGRGTNTGNGGGLILRRMRLQGGRSRPISVSMRWVELIIDGDQGNDLQRGRFDLSAAEDGLGELQIACGSLVLP
jgi:hypothetical protein